MRKEFTKAFLIITAILLCGCGQFLVGEGKFQGRLVDAGWSGIFFKSCEVDFQYGQQSSTISSGSSRKRELCSKASDFVGKEVVVKYQSWVWPCCVTMESSFELLSLEEAK